MELLLPTVNELDLGSCRVWSAGCADLKKEETPNYLNYIEHQLGEAKQFLDLNFTGMAGLEQLSELRL